MAVQPAASTGLHRNMWLFSAAERFAIPCCSAVVRAALFTGSLRERADTHVRWGTMCHHISTLSGAQYTWRSLNNAIQVRGLTLQTGTRNNASDTHVTALSCSVLKFSSKILLKHRE